MKIIKRWIKRIKGWRNRKRIKGWVIVRVNVGTRTTDKAKAHIEEFKQDFLDNNMLPPPGYRIVYIPVRPPEDTRIEILPFT